MFFHNIFILYRFVLIYNLQFKLLLNKK